MTTNTTKSKQQPPLRTTTKITVFFTDGSKYTSNNVVDYGVDAESDQYKYTTMKLSVVEGVSVEVETNVTIPLAELLSVEVKHPYGLTTVLNVPEYRRSVRTLG